MKVQKRRESGKAHQPDPPRREKSNMDAPQEEFIAPTAVPSKSKPAAKEAARSHTRTPMPGYET